MIYECYVIESSLRPRHSRCESVENLVAEPVIVITVPVTPLHTARVGGLYTLCAGNYYNRRYTGTYLTVLVITTEGRPIKELDYIITKLREGNVFTDVCLSPGMG